MCYSIHPIPSVFDKTQRLRKDNGMFVKIIVFCFQFEIPTLVKYINNQNTINFSKYNTFYKTFHTL